MIEVQLRWFITSNLSIEKVPVSERLLSIGKKAPCRRGASTLLSREKRLLAYKVGDPSREESMRSVSVSKLNL